MRAAVIENGKVANIIEVETLEVLPGLIDAGTGAIGDMWDGSSFVAPPADPELRKAAIYAQIAQLERDAMLNRGSRELELRLMEKEAGSRAAETGATVEQVLAAVPYYAKVKALDDQIAALREQL